MAAVQVVHCPSCGAPLHPTRFARTARCDFCGATALVDPDAVPRARFRRAFEAWSDPRTHGFDADRCVVVAERRWEVAGWLAQGAHAEVYSATLARRPTERVVLKVATDEHAGTALHRQEAALSALAGSSAAGADAFVRRLPAVVASGVLASGPAAGRAALVLRWPSGFVHTFEEVAREYPTGVPPEASVWMWRRVLEVLSFVHRSGWVHGALRPEHLLVHPREHGVLVVGWSAATPVGAAPLAEAGPPAAGADRPRASLDPVTLDLATLARALVRVLGGAPERGSLPGAVPPALAELVLSAAEGRPVRADAWALRERVGEVAREVFGPPRFIPFAMPGW